MLQCNSSLAPNIVRSEGATELVGDIVVCSCPGGVAARGWHQVPAGDRHGDLSAPVTSRF